MRSTKVFQTAVVCVAMMSVGVCGLAQAMNQATSDVGGTTLVVPAGTVIPLTLVDGIKAKSTPLGGTVRATVAFPVTVGTRLAIPEGVYAEGQLVQSQFPKGYKQPKGAVPISPLQVHFTKLIYPNGYTVALDAQVSAELLRPELQRTVAGVEMAALEMPEVGRGGGPGDGDLWMEMAAEAPQTTYPPLPPLPEQHVGPNPVAIAVPLAAVPVVVVTTAVLLNRRHARNFDSVLFGPGYALQMTVKMPLTLDAAKVGTAAVVGVAGSQ